MEIRIFYPYLYYIKSLKTLIMKKVEIKLIQNKAESYFKVTVNGKDAYNAFTYNCDPDNEADARTIAKACAFDEICREQFNGNKVSVSYLSY